jgi:hypothetical protein
MRKTAFVAAVAAAWSIVQTPVSAQVPGRQVIGEGTPGHVPVWVGGKRIGDSSIRQDPFGTLLVAVEAEYAIRAESTSNLGLAAGLHGIATMTPFGWGVEGLGSQAGVTGITNGTTGFPMGVQGLAPVPNGRGVYGAATFPGGVGLVGHGHQNGVAAEARSDGTVAIGVNAFAVESESGIGVYGAGVHTGIVGSTQSCLDPAAVPGGCATPGVAGEFVTGPGGTVLLGQVVEDSLTPTRTPVFRVDSTGKGFFNGGTQVGGADFAESIRVGTGDRPYGPGDLLVVDEMADRQITMAARPYSTLVAGIYSTRPGILAAPRGMDQPPAQAEVPVAIVGIVPCKVSAENGPIRRGDLLVASSTPGHAMKGTDRARMLGAVIGKAMGSQAAGTGVIEVLVTLQ